MHEQTPVSPLHAAQIEAARSAYRQLCEKYVQENSETPLHQYVGKGALNKAVLDRQVRAFELYAPYVTDGMSILDWGCRHAPDSCMLKTVFPNVRLSGCDIMDEDFSIFFDYAGLDYRPLEHTFHLPFEDETFDLLIGGGVLEHVAFQFESLKEVWRVLKKDGLFIITFLPNSKSLSENVCRVFGVGNPHNRTYNLSATRKMLLRHGFYVEKSGYHQIFPSLGDHGPPNRIVRFAKDALVPLNRPIERIPVLRSIASNLYFVLRKVTSM